MDYKMIRKINKALNGLGFTNYKDVLGVYYNKTTHRFSIMKHGNTFICYYNINKNNQWVLVEQSSIMQDYVKALHWVYDRATKAL